MQKVLILSHRYFGVLATFAGAMLSSIVHAENLKSQQFHLVNQSTTISSSGKAFEGKSIAIKCQSLIVSITCKHSIEKEADTEGPLFCNNNQLGVRKNGQTVAVDYGSLDLYSPSELMRFSTPVELSCLKLDKQYEAYVGVSFGVPSCGGKCESAFLIEQNGKIFASLGTFSISAALKSSRILRIEK